MVAPRRPPKARITEAMAIAAPSSVRSQPNARDGRVLGCIMEGGTVTRGTKVTVEAPNGVVHEGVVVSLRHRWDDLDSVSHGELREFGLLVEPAYLGSDPAHVRSYRSPSDAGSYEVERTGSAWPGGVSGHRPGRPVVLDGLEADRLVEVTSSRLHTERSSGPRSVVPCAQHLRRSRHRSRAVACRRRV